MFPLRDVNPTRITPYVTLALIGASLFVFFFVQARQSPWRSQDDFALLRWSILCDNPKVAPRDLSQDLAQLLGGATHARRRFSRRHDHVIGVAIDAEGQFLRGGCDGREGEEERRVEVGPHDVLRCVACCMLL